MTAIAATSPLLSLADALPTKAGAGGSDGFAPVFAALLSSSEVPAMAVGPAPVEADTPGTPLPLPGTPLPDAPLPLPAEERARVVGDVLPPVPERVAPAAAAPQLPVEVIPLPLADPSPARPTPSAASPVLKQPRAEAATTPPSAGTPAQTVQLPLPVEGSAQMLPPALPLPAVVDQPHAQAPGPVIAARPAAAAKDVPAAAADADVAPPKATDPAPRSRIETPPRPARFAPAFAPTPREEGEDGVSDEPPATQAKATDAEPSAPVPVPQPTPTPDAAQPIAAAPPLPTATLPTRPQPLSRAAATVRAVVPTTGARPVEPVIASVKPVTPDPVTRAGPRTPSVGEPAPPADGRRLVGLVALPEGGAVPLAPGAVSPAPEPPLPPAANGDAVSVAASAPAAPAREPAEFAVETPSPVASLAVPTVSGSPARPQASIAARPTDPALTNGSSRGPVGAVATDAVQRPVAPTIDSSRTPAPPNASPVAPVVSPTVSPVVVERPSAPRQADDARPVRVALDTPVAQVPARAASTGPQPVPLPQPAPESFGAALHRAVVAERRPRREAMLEAISTPAAPAALTSPASAPVDTGSADWPATMLTRIEQLRDQLTAPGSPADTRIRLHPDALGSVEVTLRQDASGTHVQLAAAEPAAAKLLADAQPQLQSLAEQRGLRLAQTDIGAGNTQMGQGWTGDRRQPAPQNTLATPRRSTPANDAHADESADTRLA